MGSKSTALNDVFGGGSAVCKGTWSSQPASVAAVGLGAVKVLGGGRVPARDGGNPDPM